MILKKYQPLFERIFAQTVIWDGAVSNGGILFANMGAAISKRITISTNEYFCYIYLINNICFSVYLLIKIK